MAFFNRLNETSTQKGDRGEMNVIYGEDRKQVQGKRERERGKDSRAEGWDNREQDA